jgi:hypothetical protein
MEKANRTLDEMIRHYINYEQNIWDDLLPALQHAYNSSMPATTELDPFMMTFGHIPRNMAEIGIEPSSTSIECVSEVFKQMQGLVTSAVTSIDQENKATEGYANRWSRGGEKFAQFEFVFEFANIRRIRILQMTGKFAEFEFEFQHRNSNSPKRIRIRIESCFQNSRILAENSNSNYDSA